MPKIVFVTEILSLSTGGTRFIVEVLNHLKRRGYDVDIVSCGIDYESFTSSDILNKINVINLGIYNPKILPSMQPTNVARFLIRVHHVLKKNSKNSTYILHLNNHFPNLLTYMLKPCFRDIPIVCSIHHLESTQEFSGLIYKLGKIFLQDILEVNSPCTVVHVPSNYVKQQIRSTSISNRNNIVVIPPGIETKKYMSISRRPRDDMFLMIGRLEKRKHYEHAIAAFKLVSKYKPHAKLFIVGDGPLKTYLLQMVKQLALEKNVFLLGAIDENTKLELLSQAQALIHLGYPEGFGISILEALAVGVPVISYNVPPINETVINGINGILVKKDNVIELAKTILELDKTATFNERTIKSTAKKYDIELISNKFDTLYKSLLQYHPFH